ncbi:hypothetical protein BV392_18675 [Rhodovulum sulfidophilum]|nr:hypothetical protein BV392_18675 [Rhodovulum sulfidophilum]
MLSGDDLHGSVPTLGQAATALPGGARPFCNIDVILGQECNRKASSVAELPQQGRTLAGLPCKRLVPLSRQGL